ncbi:hypothetical protein D3261_17085 [Halococcus sp. IIIV-5B]|nr:hypothetical protein D3261_17085 [Halococcus sp. IIIV-5B]
MPIGFNVLGTSRPGPHPSWTIVSESAVENAHRCFATRDGDSPKVRPGAVGSYGRSVRRCGDEQT